MNKISSRVEVIIRRNLDEILSLRDSKVLKADNSYVSKGDLLCEQLIKDFIKTEAPEYALISEESPEGNLEALNSEKLIILDPIDGTENFVSGLKEWGVSFCVYEKGKCTEALLALPELDLYLKTGEEVKRFESRIAGISSSLTKEDILNLKDGFEYRIIGCCVYNMYNVVTGSYHSFENPKGAKVWDIIAGLNLALDNNLKVSVNNKEYHGELLRPDQKYIFRIEQN
ncbi:inositol monophosphatase family protein [Sphingobacterium wenxiniae]|uniref:3'(2'),5'-bisphosphate nucleotidase n=1 Tax=Sphingobacterium wenxiniae TaxID=683125 RepID=A0A1I6U7X8_9SPHI|nr:inositol monophosphatase family protein [Sphingobacterium wenxiniae]SFS97501.1 3'(2'),5'-bisphosphate nucleotidase [Sphingobacterium wenxiniae]